MGDSSPTPAPSAALTVRERRTAIAHLAVRRGSTAHDPRFAQVLGAPLPQGPRSSQAGAVRTLGIAPGRWLVLREAMDPDFCADLAAQLRTLAAVCELSDAYRVFELKGPAVRSTLAKLIAMDLHERAFAVGQVAASIAAHIPVTLWRESDEGAAVFVLAVACSYAASLCEVLDEAAAEFGAAWR